jgi:hypothetical protein
MFGGIGIVKFEQFSEPPESEEWTRAFARDLLLPFNKDTPFKQVHENVELLFRLVKKVTIKDMNTLQHVAMQPLWPSRPESAPDTKGKKPHSTSAPMDSDELEGLRAVNQLTLAFQEFARYLCRTWQCFAGIGPVGFARLGESERMIRDKAMEIGLPFGQDTPYKRVYDTVEILYTISKKIPKKLVHELQHAVQQPSSARVHLHQKFMYEVKQIFQQSPSV